MLARELLDAAVKSGEPLVAVHRISFFRDWARSSIHRLIRTGKLPAVRIGRSYYCTPAIATEALAENSKIPALDDGAHEAAVESLRRKKISARRGR